MQSCPQCEAEARQEDHDGQPLLVCYTCGYKEVVKD